MKKMAKPAMAEHGGGKHSMPTDAAGPKGSMGKASPAGKMAAKQMKKWGGKK